MNMTLAFEQKEQKRLKLLQVCWVTVKVGKVQINRVVK